MTTEEAYKKFWQLLGIEDERGSTAVDVVKAIALLTERVEKLEQAAESSPLHQGEK